MTYPPAHDRLTHLIAQEINTSVDTWKLALWIARNVVKDPAVQAEIWRIGEAHAAGQPCGDQNCGHCFGASAVSSAGVVQLPPTNQPDTARRLSVQHTDALWDAIAIPGPRTPTFTEQHERVCAAVADILDEMTPADELPPTNQAAPSHRAELRDEIAAALEAADYRMDMRRGDLADAVLPVLYREWPWLRAETEDAVVLTDAERTMLTYALDQAQEHIWSRDGFTDEDQAAVDSLRRMAAEAPATEEQDEACDHDSQVITHEGAQYWACLKCGQNHGQVDDRPAVVQPAQPHNDETPDSDPIETGTEAALGQAEERLRQVLGVAEVIEVNGIGWAADSVRRAAKGELS